VKILLIVIDAATPHVVCPAVRTGQFPVLQQLVDAGTMHERSVSIFPSITPAATTSIITGCYPAEHGIAGASWFDRTRGEVAYYGDDFWVIAREGFGDFIRDFLLRLNGDRLIAPTLFEMVERSGRQAACLNYLVFRGNVPHHVRIPGLLAALPGVPLSETVEGPSILYLGDFVGTPSSRGRRLEEKGGILHRFGMDDASTGAMLIDLFEQGGLPDFTVAYFADNDYRSHEVGPYRALDVLARIDEVLSEAFAVAGGMQRVLDETCIVITSDHGHCDVLRDPTRAVIRLDSVLSNYRQAKLGGAWGPRDEIMICPNMRAAQIYVRKPSPDIVARLGQDLLAHPLVDQVIGRTGLAVGGSDGYSVFTSRGNVRFSRALNGSADAEDVFGGRWRWSGEPATVDMAHDGRTIVFDQYPNAFERIAGVLDLEHSGELWVTAKPGAEFEVPGGKAHVGGASHGALHALDSHSPVILAGGGIRPTLPRDLRSIDIAPLCMQLLGIPMRYCPGDPR
jgi:hypothetical protein